MCARSDLQDDLADVRAGFRKPVSFCSQSEREGCVEDASHLSSLDQRPDLLVQRPGTGTMEWDLGRERASRAHWSASRRPPVETTFQHR